MNNQNPFDEEYVGGTPSTAAPEAKSLTKQFLKQPIEQQELMRYGTSKPTRVQIRAKLINGKG
ncbi:hypothetical protein MTYP_03312 [Methylophilaceae bacterium]|nr:hypothetical protein MTYP_03312 [Methylophilaceae bacterium]